MRKWEGKETEVKGGRSGRESIVTLAVSLDKSIDLQFIVTLEIYLVLSLTLLVADIDCGDKLARGDKLIIDATLLEEIAVVPWKYIAEPIKGERSHQSFKPQQDK